MSVIRHVALQKGFAVAYVVLTREVPVQKFEAVYQEIVRQLTLKPHQAGIRTLIQSWLQPQEPKKAAPNSASQDAQGADIAAELQALPGMDLNFSNALSALHHLHHAPLAEKETPQTRAEASELIYQWLEGGKVSKAALKSFQIFDSLNKANGKRFLASLIAFLRYTGSNGLVLLMDELETVLAHGASIRNAAYESVRLFIDNTEQSQYLHTFFSIIPDVLSAEKGFKSYDALWSRVRSIGEGKRLNYRSVLIDLHRTPLESKELLALGQLVRHIHQTSYRWSADAVTDSVLERLYAAQKRMGTLSEVRLYIKAVIRLLDSAEQGNPIDDETDLAAQLEAGQREVQAEKWEMNQPRWDS